MFSQNLLSCLTRFYTYPWSRVTFLMPFNCQSSLRTYSTKKPIPISYGQKQLDKRNTRFAIQKSYTMNSTAGRGVKKAKRKPTSPRSYATEYATANSPTTTPQAAPVKRFIDSAQQEELPQSVSTTQALREFFSHPLTWDRNNGYLNILLGLAIFGYCFCTTCNGETSSKVSYEADKRK